MPLSLREIKLSSLTLVQLVERIMIAKTVPQQDNQATSSTSSSTLVSTLVTLLLLFFAHHHREFLAAQQPQAPARCCYDLILEPMLFSH